MTADLVIALAFTAIGLIFSLTWAISWNTGIKEPTKTIWKLLETDRDRFLIRAPTTAEKESFRGCRLVVICKNTHKSNHFCYDHGTEIVVKGDLWWMSFNEARKTYKKFLKVWQKESSIKKSNADRSLELRKAEAREVSKLLYSKAG